MNKIYDVIKLADNVTVSLENRYSEKKDSYYDCVCLNVDEKSIVLTFDSKLFNTIKKINK